MPSYKYLISFIIYIYITAILTADDFSDDFSDEYSTSYSSDSPIQETVKKKYNLQGDITFSSAYNFAHEKPSQKTTDWRKFSKCKSELNLKLEIDFNKTMRFFASVNAYYDYIYKLKENEYTDEVLDQYQKDYELRKLYFRETISEKLDLKIGRQIIVWGKSDNIRITDILNPLDLREPGLTDIEDLRLPLFMSKIDYYFNNWNLSLILNHEKRYNKLPAYGSDFYYYPININDENKREISFQSPETALALNGIFQGFDISFYLANVYDDNPSLQLKKNTPATIFELKHENIFMSGIAFNKAFENILIKSEAALLEGLKYSLSTDEYKRFDYLLGFEYQGFRNTSVSFEVANRHIIKFASIEANNLIKENSWQYAFRCSKLFHNDILEITFLALLHGEKGNDGAIYRLTADYDLSDSIVVYGGLITYDYTKESQIEQLENNDRIFFNIKYSF